VLFPSPDLCTDNGAMIAYAGLLRLEAGQQTGLEVQVRARWPLGDLAAGAAASA
jgi:N6-L-threonylcarbamoyladenine synthase